MRELMRSPEIARCRRCTGWYMPRYGFGHERLWCSKECWLRSRERRLWRRARGGPRLFVSGPCVVCGGLFTVGLGSNDPLTGGKFCSAACDNTNKKRVNRANRAAEASLPCATQKCEHKRKPEDIVCVVCFDRVKRSCVGKQRLRTSFEARRRLNLHRQRPCNRGPVCPGVSAYWCFICDTRHMGHTTAEMSELVNRAAMAMAAGMPRELRAEMARQWRTARPVAVAGG